MPNTLDILALEPFYGGFRREMLETLARTSRHRWKILKLPPRRLERRLTTAATWFAEQMHRHSAGHFDVLFASEALNLADLYRLVPTMSSKPAVIYFHSHQLGEGETDGAAHDYANLSSASAATEIWFISRYGRRDFFSAAQAVVARDAELRAQDILTGLTQKAHVVAPPVELMKREGDAKADEPSTSIPALFVNTKSADMVLLNDALDLLRRRNVSPRLKVDGPVSGLASDVQFDVVSAVDKQDCRHPTDRSNIFLSASPGCAFDEQAVRAVATGMTTLLPMSGGYVELVPTADHSAMLYEVNAEALANAVQRALSNAGTFATSNLRQELGCFDALKATRSIDDRLLSLRAT